MHLGERRKILKLCYDSQHIYEHYVVSSDGSPDEEYSDETAMMQSVLEGAERAEEHVLNFKGSIKGHRVLNRNRRAVI